MFSTAWSFVKRHKRKFIALGVAAGVGGAAYYYTKKLVEDGMAQVEEMGKALQESLVVQQLGEEELRRVSAECAETIRDFIVPVRRQIQKCTDARPIAAKLKAVRASSSASPSPGKKENSESGSNGATLSAAKESEKLWEDLKVVILTRMISETYAIVLLSLLLRVQLHVMARATFAEIVQLHREKAAGRRASEDAEFESKVTQSVREKFLFKASEHFVRPGVKSLVSRVKAGVASASSEWKMGADATVSRTEIVEMISERIRGAIEQGDRAWLIDCLFDGGADGKDLMKGEGNSNDDAEERLLIQSMLDETMDMIESPHFMQVLLEGIDAAFEVLGNSMRERDYSDNMKIGEGEEEKLILAKVVVDMKKVSSEIVDPNANGRYMDALDALPGLKNLCTAIFDADGELMNDAMGLGLGADDLKSLSSLIALLGEEDAGEK